MRLYALKPDLNLVKESSIKTIFVQGPFLGYRLLLVAILSCALIFVDNRFDYLDKVRHALGSALTPMQWLSNLPKGVVDWVDEVTTSRVQLQEDVDAMKARTLVLERKAQKFAFIMAENGRLRELLNASGVVDETVKVAELIGVSPDPFKHYVIINKGRLDGVVVGQAVLDSNGLFGQVIEVSEFASRVLLISDNSHAVPVQVNRSGVRAIALGNGNYDYLELANVPDTADIQEGDLLVSSGLGGKFPPGYPVAEVNSVQHDPGQPFARVTAQPRAQLNRSLLVLVVTKHSVDEQDGEIEDNNALSEELGDGE
ncbi:rod shape-determining protein MreC [Alkalimarinus alittae]|uniref:Cell shape-determining protein MreC n=1 Tax=Alkalimarinus alittae TaxID=2961619 RepID=A0ABY6MZE9_9ALTE|nr:rod shape-determining protein MreC [Alkalimarinus alittae]UZE95218.1 rod shape-determining protein MreC [Alkalimarinus alittae]